MPLSLPFRSRTPAPARPTAPADFVVGAPPTPDATIDWYNAHAREYEGVHRYDVLDGWRQMLLERVAVGSHVLDAGCGAGRDTVAFLGAGFRVSAYDASRAMTALATRATGGRCRVRVMRHQDVELPTNSVRAIWASKTLVHVPRPALPDVFRRLGLALEPGGYLLATFGLGEADGPVADGRHYTFFTPERFRAFLPEIPWMSEVSLAIGQDPGHPHHPDRRLFAALLCRTGAVR